MKTIALKIAYDGSSFNGFAPQSNENLNTISETIYFALKSLNIDSMPVAAGRTDKGVHALGMVISIVIPSFWELEKLKYELNKKLSPKILVRKIIQVESNFHARFSCVSRSYLYLFSENLKSPFVSSFIAKEKMGDLNIIKECLEMIKGEHDFRFFKKEGSAIKDSIRTIYVARFREFSSINSHGIILKANGFLRSQVRLMIGAILAASRNELTLEEFSLQLNAESRFYSIPASPNGLFFLSAKY